jgi:leucyl-tRNA synthetase
MHGASGSAQHCTKGPLRPFPRSQGATIRFPLAAGPGAALPGGAEVEVFTTRPDPLAGATYLVVAPEHALLGALCTPGQHRAEVVPPPQRHFVCSCCRAQQVNPSPQPNIHKP